VGTMVLATMYNPLEYLEPESLDLEITIDPADLSARIESVAVRENEVYAGDSLQVLVRVKPVLSDAVTLELEVPVPPSLAPGRRALMICDGHTSDLLDLKEAPNRMEPRSIEEFLSLLDLPLGPRVLAARMAGAGFGLARAGREFPSLPSSALAVLSAPEETSLSPLYRSTLATLDTPYVLSGRQVVPILVKAPFEEKSE
jgi:hypothetical protein